MKTMRRILVTAAALFAIAVTAHAARDVVVSADGKGDFKTVQEAVDAVPPGQRLLHLIRIKPGTYKELVNVPAGKGPVKFLGEDAATTVLSFNNSAKTLNNEGKEIGTFRSASVFIEADDFSAENVTFENTYGQGSQALAVSVGGDRAVFRKCRFVGWQDTVLLRTGRQYFEECHVSGHVDFIFGGATAFFDRCEINCRAAGYITAASTPKESVRGFVFSRCRITAEPGEWKTFLGRPWRPFASVVFLHSELPAAIQPEGWDNWRNPENEKTARFAECGNTGPGAEAAARVPWAKKLTEREARALVPRGVLRQWDPKRGVSARLVAELPAPARAAWEAYLVRSAERHAAEVAALDAELKASGATQALLPPSGPDFKLPSHPTLAWFSSPEAKQLAANVMSFQTPSGGWSKHIAFEKGPRLPGMHWSGQGAPGQSWHYVGTIDNRSTTEQLLLLAGVHSATRLKGAREAFLKGFDYLIEAQFPSGGWPQVYPLEGGYHDCVTFNDNAMVHVLELMRDVAGLSPEFSFVDAERRAKAARAFDNGIRCVLSAQVRQQGRPTVWCAQHDPLTLEPVAARKQEPASLSGGESAGIVRFLMEIPNPPEEVVGAIENALAWFEQTKITGLRKTKRDGRTVYEADPAATQPLWARFCDLETNKPLFAGSQDGLIYDSFADMAVNNGVGYDYHTSLPEGVLGSGRAKWQKERR